MINENRLGNPACTFPIAYSFGDQSPLCSESGAEAILETMKKHNDGQVCLFKIEKAGHNIQSENPKALFAAMKGFFDGEHIDNKVWQPTRRGDYQWHGETPKKDFVHPDKW